MTDVQEIINALAPLTQKLGQGGSYVYQAYYRQEFINGLGMLLWSLAGLVSLVTGIISFKRGIKKPDGSYYNYSEGLIELGFFTVLLGAGIILITLPGGIAHFVNPAYYAIQDLLANVRAAQ